jgi:hypothetical protein
VSRRTTREHPAIPYDATVAHALDLPLWSSESAARVAGVLDEIAAREAREAIAARRAGDRADREQDDEQGHEPDD